VTLPLDPEEALAALMETGPHPEGRRAEREKRQIPNDS